MVGGLSAAVAAAWLFVLSGVTGVVPGAPLTKRINVLFSSDSADTIKDYVGDRVVRGQGVHRLINLIYVAPVRAGYRGLRKVMPEEQAAVVAGRGFNAAIAGIGVGCVIGLALRRGLRISALPPLLMVNLLATSMVLVAVPEHFGVSYSLLSMTFVVAAADLRLIWALGLLGVFTVVDAGVTLTNGAFPVAASAVVVWRKSGGRFPSWFLWTFGVMLLLGSAGLTAIVWHLESRHEPVMTWIRTYFNMRLVNDPASAGTFACRGLVDPVIGPTPVVNPGDDTTPPMVSYEPCDAPYRLWPYDLAQGVGAACWIFLFLMSCVTLFRSPDRSLAVLLSGWIGFNLIFHNVWGMEFFLYSPHWSWALLAMVFLGARHQPTPRIVLLCLPLAAAQFLTLTKIWAAVALINA